MLKVFRQAGHNGLKTFPPCKFGLRLYIPVNTGFLAKIMLQKRNFMSFSGVVA
jgi:hypothetical protein